MSCLLTRKQNEKLRKLHQSHSLLYSWISSKSGILPQPVLFYCFVTSVNFHAFSYSCKSPSCSKIDDVVSYHNKVRPRLLPCVSQWCILLIFTSVHAFLPKRYSEDSSKTDRGQSQWEEGWPLLSQWVFSMGGILCVILYMTENGAA